MVPSCYIVGHVVYEVFEFFGYLLAIDSIQAYKLYLDLMYSIVYTIYKNLCFVFVYFRDLLIVIYFPSSKCHIFGYSFKFPHVYY